MQHQNVMIQPGGQTTVMQQQAQGQQARMPNGPVMQMQPTQQQYPGMVQPGQQVQYVQQQPGQQMQMAPGQMPAGSVVMPAQGQYIIAAPQQQQAQTMVPQQQQPVNQQVVQPQ